MPALGTIEMHLSVASARVRGTGGCLLIALSVKSHLLGIWDQVTFKQKNREE